MSIRVLFIVLTILFCLLFGSASSYFIYKYMDNKKAPQKPCTSTITDGRFIDEGFINYRFNGVITWWPKLNRITIFGVRSDDGGDKVISRALQLKDVKKNGGVFSGKVAELKKASSERLPDNFFMISGENQYLTIMFKKVTPNNWLMLSNDNWVMMCEYK